MKYKLIKRNDIIIVAVSLLIAFLFYLFVSGGGDSLIAEISVGGEVTDRISLSEVTEKQTIIPETNPKVVIVAENGTIRFDSAECEDKICVSAGKLSRKGDTAVCLPARVVISIVGSDLDAVTY